jgi:hypothetical protein
VENRIKEAKNTLRWDKTSCHRFEANQARLKMGALAYNLLHMIREFHLQGEDVKRSMEWLIRRIIKAASRFHTVAAAGGCTWLLHFLWLTTTRRCWVLAELVTFQMIDWKD